MGAWRGEDTRGAVVNFLNQFRPRLSQVRADAIGIGHNFALHLRDCRFPVEMINVAMVCESKPRLREADPARRFANLKARFYQTLADAFERDQVEGLTDEETIGQLAGVLYEIDSQGRIRIESKEQARARGVPSPDRAEALMLALGELPPEYAYHSIRDLGRLRSGVSGGSTSSGLSSFQEIADDDDDDLHRIRSSRRWDAFVGRWTARRGGASW